MFMDPTHKCKLHPKAGLILKDCGTFPSRNGTVIHKIVVKCAEPKCNRRVGKPLMYRHTVESTPLALRPKNVNWERDPIGRVEMYGWLVFVVLAALLGAWMISNFPAGWWSVFQ